MKGENEHYHPRTFATLQRRSHMVIAGRETINLRAFSSPFGARIVKDRRCVSR